jgi:hypothetical protein
MRASNELSAWLDAPEVRAHSAGAVENFGKRFRQRPEFVRLEAELDGVSTGAEALAAGSRFFTDKDAVARAVEEMAAEVEKDRFFRPPFRTPLSPIHYGLILFDHPALSLMLAVLSRDALGAKRTFADGARSISFGGQQTVFHFIRSGGANLSFWEAPEIGGDFVGSDALRCRCVSRRQIADGESIRVDGRREAFVIDHASSDMVYIQALTTLESAPLMAEYDSERHQFVGASSTDDLGCRAGMMLSLLRLMDRSDAAPLFAELTRTGHFNSRWHAMREFLALDAQAALPHLSAMAEADPHPEVRAAAAQTLAAFFPEPAEREDMLCPA